MGSVTGSSGRNSVLGGSTGHVRQPFPVRLPPRRVHRRHVSVLGPVADGTVDELAQDVSVAKKSVGLGDHVHQPPVKGRLPPVGRLPR